MTGMSAVLTVVLVIGAVWVITRFLIKGEMPLVKIPREALVIFFDPSDEDVTSGRASARKRTVWEKSLAYLIECGWCASLYVAAWLVPLVAHFAPVPLPWLVVLTSTGITGALVGWEAIHDQRYELVVAQINAAKATAYATMNPDPAGLRR
jgi:uncharacterized protein DUF1360